VVQCPRSYAYASCWPSSGEGFKVRILSRRPFWWAYGTSVKTRCLMCTQHGPSCEASRPVWEVAGTPCFDGFAACQTNGIPDRIRASEPSPGGVCIGDTLRSAGAQRHFFANRSAAESLCSAWLVVSLARSDLHEFRERQSSLGSDVLGEDPSKSCNHFHMTLQLSTCLKQFPSVIQWHSDFIMPPTALAIEGSRSFFCCTSVPAWPDPCASWCPRRGAPTGVAREIAVLWTKIRTES
jgi:hypothetical protein